jgi:hypothetical protein
MATDNCDPNPVINYTDQTSGNVITRTWTATDACGNGSQCDQIITIAPNNPPIADCPSDIDTLLCALDTVCLAGFSCSDPDDNLVSCEVTGGVLDGDVVCFEPVEGRNNIILTATDDCGLVAVCTTKVDVAVNSPPTVECPDNLVYEVLGFPAEICIPGFGCDDPDGNLVSCDVQGGTLLGDTVCFTVYNEGSYTITITAVDECGVSKASATCQTAVSVRKVLPVCPIIKIEKTHDTYQGHYEEVSITIDDGSYEIGGFDFLIAYDASALTFIEANKGQMLEDCEWEYFTYRFGAFGNCGDACPSGMLRIVAMAETNDGSNHPLCFGPPDTGEYELAKMKFMVSNNYNLEGQYVPIYFFWGDCGDNILSSPTGDTAFIDSKIYDPFGTLIWDEGDDALFPESNRIPFVGAPDDCLNFIPGKPSAIRCAEFVNGGIDIIPIEEIDDRGDINLNGVPYEIADAVTFVGFFIYGPAAFTVNFEGQKAATDVNGDGIPLTVADLAYLIRVIIGDSPPMPPKFNPDIYYEVDFALENEFLFVSRTDQKIGVIHMVIEGNAQPSLAEAASHMQLRYDFDGVATRLLVYDLDGGYLGEGPVLDLHSKFAVRSIEAGSYDGYQMKANTINPLPEDFKLMQSYPNPFNATVTIKFALPYATEWTLTVYNVLGREVEKWTGHNSKGGIEEITWDAGQFSSGIYFYRLKSGEFVDTRRMILLK